jgi:hypothetical protein
VTVIQQSFVYVCGPNTRLDIYGFMIMLFLQVRPQGGRQVLDLQRARLHPRHGDNMNCHFFFTIDDSAK